MALLNYASKYEIIKNLFSLNENKNKIYFTGDGHILTHGIDYIKPFSTDTAGIVNPGGTDPNIFLRPNNTWSKLNTADLPIVKNIKLDITSDFILNAEQTQALINLSYVTNDAMRFKGSIGLTRIENRVVPVITDADGTRNGFPKKCSVGDTYRITNRSREYDDFKFAGQIGSVGDMLICIKDGEYIEGVSKESLNSANYWTLVESNINGVTDYYINNKKYSIYSNSLDSFKIYAPTSTGSENQLLKWGANNDFEWVNPSSITVGTAKEANKLKNALTISTGLRLVSGSTSLTSYNGENAATLSLKLASELNLGGIKVDISNSENKPTLSIDDGGKVFLTRTNIENALGYTPEQSGTGAKYSTIISDSASEITTKNIKNPFLNLIQDLKGNKSVASSTQFVGTSGVDITNTNSIINFTLTKATSENYGGIKIGYTASGHNYPVLLDTNSKAYVTVPIIDYVVTASKNGLVPKFDAVSQVSLTNEHWVLSAKGSTVDWYKLPLTAFQNTWRPILINGTSIENKTLNLKLIEEGSICFVIDDTNKDVYELGMGLCWYDFDKGRLIPEYDFEKK